MSCDWSYYASDEEKRATKALRESEDRRIKRVVLIGVAAVAVATIFPAQIHDALFGKSRESVSHGSDCYVTSSNTPVCGDADGLGRP